VASAARHPGEPNQELPGELTRELAQRTTWGNTAENPVQSRVRTPPPGAILASAQAGSGELLQLEPAALLALVAGPSAEAGAIAPLVADLAALARASPRHLAVASGLAPRAALRLAAAFELGRRVERARCPARQPLRTPERVHACMAIELRGLERETFHALLLDGKHRLRRAVRVSEGTLTSSLVHPREFFQPALRECAAAVIAVHNHPSGDPEPSAEDLAVTRRLIEAGELLGVPLLDHVVVADGGWVSLRERMRFP
jgi:DNA repair protein RadC